MGYYSDFNRSPADHVYLSGYGFVSGRDPLHFAERHLRRCASAVGFTLLLIPAIPLLFWRVAGVISSVIVSFFPFRADPSGLIAANELIKEFQAWILYFSAMVPACLLLRWLLQPPRQTNIPSPGSQRRSTLCAVLISVGISSMSIAGASVHQDILQLFHIIELNPGTPSPSSFPALLLYTIRIIFLPAILEEILFRGILLQSLRRHGDSFAVVFASLCASLIQYGLTGSLTGFIPGLIYGYFFLRTGSIRTSIICHMSANIFIVLSDSLQQIFSGTALQTAIIALMMAGVAAGLAGFMLFCRWNHNAFILGDTQDGVMSFRKKLIICLKTGPMIAAIAFWFFQLFRNMQVII